MALCRPSLGICIHLLLSSIIMERDDLIVNDQYAIDAHHDEAKGKLIRKKIIQVTIILSVITAIETYIGGKIMQNHDWWQAVKWSFIVMTLVKAAYIVMTFMHLGEERKNLRWVILAPYLVFAIYLIIIAFREGSDMSIMLRDFVGS